MMDCKIIAQNDLFEKYILQRLDPQEKAEFEKHLAGCANCQNELKRQEQLIAGIRETGVFDMKAEIRRQTATQEAADKKINWGKVTRIAALFFIIIVSPTVFYIYKHYIPNPKAYQTMRAMDSPQASKGQGGQSDFLESQPRENTLLAVREEKQNIPNVEQDRIGRLSETATGKGISGGPAAQKEAASEFKVEEKPTGPEIVKKIIVTEEASTPQVSAELVTTEDKDMGGSALRKRLVEPQTERIKQNQARLKMGQSGQLKPAEVPLTQALTQSSSSTANEAKNKMKPELQQEAFRSQKSSAADILSIKKQDEPQREFQHNLIRASLADSDERSEIINIELDSIKFRIKFVEPQQSVSTASAQGYPASFAVDVTKPDSNGFSMMWYFPAHALNIKPADIKLSMAYPDSVIITFSDAVIYSLRLQEGAGKAFRE